MKKKYLLAALLIIAILITTIRFADLSYSSSLDTSDDDSSQLVLSDNAAARTPIEFDLMPLLAILTGELLLLCVISYLLVSEKFLVNSYLLNSVSYIRPPPADSGFTA